MPVSFIAVGFDETLCRLGAVQLNQALGAIDIQMLHAAMAAFYHYGLHFDGSTLCASSHEEQSKYQQQACQAVA